LRAQKEARWSSKIRNLPESTGKKSKRFSNRPEDNLA